MGMEKNLTKMADLPACGGSCRNRTESRETQTSSLQEHLLRVKDGLTNSNCRIIFLTLFASQRKKDKKGLKGLKR